MGEAQVTHWWTGEITRCHDCNTLLVLPQYTDGRRRWVHCPECDRTWEVTNDKVEESDE